MKFKKDCTHDYKFFCVFCTICRKCDKQQNLGTVPDTCPCYRSSIRCTFCGYCTLCKFTSEPEGDKSWMYKFCWRLYVKFRKYLFRQKMKYQFRQKRQKMRKRFSHYTSMWRWIVRERNTVRNWNQNIQKEHFKFTSLRLNSKEEINNLLQSNILKLINCV